MSLKDDAKRAWMRGLSYRQISEKYDIPVNTIKSWANREWKKDEEAVSKKKRVAEKNATATGENKTGCRGGQYGNSNAIGNKGGAPKGNQNGVIHGGYRTTNLDTLDEDEMEYIRRYDEATEEDLLMEQIRLYTIRERRLMKAINKYRQSNDALTIDGVLRTEVTRSFSSDVERAEFETINRQRIASGSVLPGKAFELQTSTVNKDNIILRLESELTRVQRAKNQALDSLIKLRIDRKKLIEEENNDSLVELWISEVLNNRENNEDE